MLKKQQGGKGKRAGLGSRVCRAPSPWDLAFPLCVLGRWSVDGGVKIPAGLKPCADGDAVTEHFATGSQGKIHPSPPESGCSFFPFMLCPQKRPHWTSLFPRLTSSFPKISQALLVASSRAIEDVRMSQPCSASPLENGAGSSSSLQRQGTRRMERAAPDVTGKPRGKGMKIELAQKELNSW